MPGLLPLLNHMNLEKESIKIIAKFMGWNEFKTMPHKQNYYLHENYDEVLHFRDFKYSTDWNQLINVIISIKEFQIKNRVDSLIVTELDRLEQNITIYLVCLDIEKTFRAVALWVDQYFIEYVQLTA